MLGLSYTYYVNDNRVHGFTLEPEILRGYLLVASDFAIDRETLKRIVDCGVDVISTDHHEVEAEFIHYDNGVNEGVVINNQYPFEPEEDRYLSGAGVVYEVFKELTPDFKSVERDSVVGITLLSDVRPIENRKAKKFLAKLYTNTDGYISYLINSTIKSDFGFGCPKMDRNFVDFTFSPTVNAMLRFNKTSEAIDFILGKGLNTSVDYRKMQSDLVVSLKETAEVLELESVYILAVDAELYEIDVANFIGLLCSNYKNMGKSALAFVYDGGIIKRASFRGLCDNIDYRKDFQLMGIDAQGHKGAFGIKDFYPNSQTWVTLAEHIGSLEVDYKETRTIIDTNNLSLSLGTKGASIAYENCYCRDMYRTYFRYKGRNIKEIRHTFRYVPFNDDDYLSGRKPDKKLNGESLKFELDKNGNKITKYREFVIDGNTVKSFGMGVEDGLILPILEKGYLQLYVV